ncbi:MAG: hypothetical protein GY814_14640 [Gammaproteobacteria bacterium]|nr:hypothetical protein [Gammaproteobacteria bacterium]
MLNLKNQWFFNIPLKGAFAGRARASGELIRCVDPYQIIPCGPRARAHVEVLPPPLIMTVAIISEGAIIVNVVILAIILIAIIIAMDMIIAVAATVVVAVVHIVSAIAGPAGRICPAPSGPARQCAG